MSLSADNCEVVYVSISTWSQKGYVKSKKIHRLSAKLGSEFYSNFVKHTRSIRNVELVDSEGSSCQHPNAVVHEDETSALPLETVLRGFLKFLKSWPKPVVLVSHNYEFLSDVLIRDIIETQMLNMFDSVVAGFSSTIWAFQKKLPGRRTSELAFFALAKEFLSKTYRKESFDPLSALSDLQHLVSMLHVPKSALIVNSQSYATVIWQQIRKSDSSVDLKSLEVFKHAVGWIISIKMVKAGLRFSSVVKVFQQTGPQGLREYLNEKLGNIRLGRDELNEVVEKLVRLCEAHSPAKQNLVSQNDPSDEPHEGGDLNETVPFQMKQVPSKLSSNSFLFDKQRDEFFNDIESVIGGQGQSNNQVPLGNDHPSDEQKKACINNLEWYLMEDDPFNTVNEDDSSNGQEGKPHVEMGETTKGNASIDMKGLEILEHVVDRDDMVAMAEAGLQWDSLELVLQQKGSQGLREYLNEKLGNIWPSRDNLHETVEEIVRFFENQSVINQNFVDTDAEDIDQFVSYLMEVDAYNLVG